MSKEHKEDQKIIKEKTSKLLDEIYDFANNKCNVPVVAGLEISSNIFTNSIIKFVKTPKEKDKQVFIDLLTENLYTLLNLTFSSNGIGLSVIKLHPDQKFFEENKNRLEIIK